MPYSDEQWDQKQREWQALLAKVAGERDDAVGRLKNLENNTDFMRLVEDYDAGKLKPGVGYVQAESKGQTEPWRDEVDAIRGELEIREQRDRFREMNPWATADDLKTVNDFIEKNGTIVGSYEDMAWSSPLREKLIKQVSERQAAPKRVVVNDESGLEGETPGREHAKREYDENSVAARETAKARGFTAFQENLAGDQGG